MKVNSAKFIKEIASDDEILGNGIPQVAFIGRSNVGKSTVINTLTKVKDLARTSSFPGRTQRINLFLINGNTYFVDLPGYGFARLSHVEREAITDLIDSYFFHSLYKQKKVVLIIDASIGLTDTDLDMLRALEEYGKDVIILANKIDKLKNSEYKKQVKKIEDSTVGHPIIFFSSVTKVGIKELTSAVLE